MTLRVILTGGGTGGHIMPGVSLADELTRAGCAVLWVGAADGMEASIVPSRGIEFKPSGMSKVSSGVLRSPRRAMGAMFAVPNARAVIRNFKPNAVVGLGGYASVPMLLAARLTGTRYFLLEQNVIPGKVSRWFAPRAACVFSQFAEARDYFAKRTLFRHTGSPVRRELLEKLASTNDRKPGRSEVLLVLGGSQGSRAINRAVCEAVASLELELPGLRILHIAGKSEYEEVKPAYEGRPGHQVFDFCNSMQDLYSQATIAVARSGAVTLAELAVAGIPSVLVPYPHAADDHQMANAKVFCDRGAARLLPQNELTASRLIKDLCGLLHDNEGRKRAVEAARALAMPHAAPEIVKCLVESAHPETITMGKEKG